MIERLTDDETIRKAERRIRELIDAHGEWLYAQGDEGGECVQKSECDFCVSHARLLFSCWTNQGLVVWRINGWEWTGHKLLLEASRRMGAKRASLELIPRTGVEAISAVISDSRRERCHRLATLACSSLRGAKVERAGLSAGVRSGQPGRYARILLRHHNLERIAVAGTVAGAGHRDVAAFLSSTLIWFTRAGERARPPYFRKLWLIVEKDGAENLVQLLALLRSDLRRVVTLFQIDDAWQNLMPLRTPELPELLSETPGRYRRPPRESVSESAQEVVALAPEAIDVVRARHGETLRYHGLAFARVRRVLESEMVWFGIDGAGRRRRLLEETTKEEWWKLLRDLHEYRLAESLDTHHAFYRAAPEAWLESILRRDITRLDPGLRLAPLYAQFRASQMGTSRPVDLLALRYDGRLVVIELKVSEDREHVFQGADYWRRTEVYRRHGHLQRARLFGDAFIADEPPLVYLVAPTLRFHRSFNLLARALTPEIELYRFDINEDWRTGVRVMRRVTLGNY